MKAFIEYPDVSDDRIEIKGEFVIETRAHRYTNSLLSTVERMQHPVIYVNGDDL